MTPAGELERPATPVGSAEPDERMVRAFQLDFFPANAEPGDAATDTVYYAEKHAEQVWPHIERWLREDPKADVMVARVEVPMSEWLGAMCGEEADADAQERG